MKHTIAVLVENRPGVLARISGLFSARGFNIDSLAVGETHDPTVSRMTIVVDAKDERILEQIKKQLNKLIDVITISDLTKKEFIDRELILIKLNLGAGDESRLLHIIGNFPARLLDKVNGAAIIEACGTQEEIRGLLNALEPFGIKELVRTGRIAMGKS